MYGIIVVKTEYILPNFSSSNVFDSSCQQRIDDEIIVSNVADIQEIVTDLNANVPFFIDNKEKIEETISCLNEYNSTTNETCSVSLNPQTSADNDYISIAS